jgi:outer membrane protein assembly factor BamE
MSIKNIISALFLSFSLSGCSFLYDTFVYQIDVTQGNYLEDEKLDQVKVGMTQEQVIFILGSPMLIDQFDSSKWYYIRYIKPGGEKAQQQHVVLTFNKKILSSMERKGPIDENPLQSQKLKNAPNTATESTSEDSESKADNTVTIEQ